MSGEAGKLQPVVALAATHLPNAPGGDESWTRFGALANPAYLWLKRGEGPAVTEVKIVYGDEAAADGWVKVPEDLNSSSVGADRKPVFLHYRVGGETSPILDLKIYTTHDPIVGPGFARIEEILNPEADKTVAKEHLCFKTVASQAKLDAADYKVGDMIDCKDTANNWCQAQIMAVKGDQVLVHYKGWSEKWDEWMDRKSKRIAPHRSKTLGRATGWEGDREAFMLKEKEKGFMEVFNKTEEIVGGLEGAAEFKELSKDEVFFLTTQNLQFVLNCLNSICDDQELLGKVQRFFERNLFLAVAYLKNAEEVPQQFLEGVVKIFKGDNQYTRFYTKYGVKGGEPNLKGNFAMRPASQVVGEDKLLTSAYLIWMLNYFGDLGGFDAVAKRLTDTKFQGDSFFNVALMVKALAVSRNLLTPEFGPAFVKSLDLPAMLPATLRRITDHELKTLTKDAIKDLAKDCELLLNMKGTHYKSTEVAELMERVNVDIALRLLTAKVLEKRLNGCVEIEETIKRVIRKERPGALPPVTAQPGAGIGLGMGIYGPAAPGAAAAAAADPGPAQYLTSEYLIKWIEENKVVDILLGPGSHEQIIKRSPAVLKFLASHGALTVEHIDALWASSIDKHEGLVRIVYDTLADLAQELSDEQLDALFSRISVVSFADYTDFVLDFIKKFTVSAVKATKVEGKWFGLDIFWQLLQEDAKVSPSIAQHAAQTLKELLEQPLFEKQRLVYLDKCLENITSGVSVVPSLRLAKTIIAMYPVQSTANAPAAVTIGKLMEHLSGRNILKIVLDDLVRYDHEAQKALAAAEGKEKENKDSSNGPDRDVLIGGTPHYSVNLQTRLDFIDFLLSCSDKLHLDQAGIDTLWSVFVTNAVTKDDKTLLLTWLNAVVTDDASRRPFPAFDAAVANYVFSGLLCNPDKLDYATLPKLGYECFETYFVHVNHVSGALLTTSRRFMAIGDYHKLVGLPSLWQVASSAQDPAVAAQAKLFLTTMHIKLDYKYTSGEKKSIFKGFVDEAMQRLTVAARALQTQAPDVDAQRHRAGAVLDIIDLFLERCHNGETIEQPKYKEGESVRASWKGGSRLYEAKVVRVNREGTYWLHYADGDVDQACPESSIQPLVEKPVAKAPRDNETNDYPKFLLSNEKAYFDLLFELLGAGGELSPKVWRLLERLPTNQDLAAKIRALDITDASGNKDWDLLLPTGRVIKLLYSLQIVDSNLQVQEGDEAHRKEVHDWSQAFLTQGGFAHIYSILAGADERSMVAEPLQQRCLMYLLKLVNHFINPASALDAPAALGMVDLAALEARLLNVIAASAEVKTAPPAPKPAARPARAASPAGRGRTIGPLPAAASSAEGEGETAAAAPIVEDPTSLLVAQAFAVLNLLLTNKPETLETVYAFGGWKETISAGLIFNHSAAYRRALTHGIFGICSHFNKSVSPRPPRTFFLPELLKCLPDLAVGNGTGPIYCTEFFSLLQGLLRGSTPEDGSIDPKALAEQVADRIKKHPIVEKRLDDHDEVLNGFFTLASTLASKYPDLKAFLGADCGLLEEVFHCLFDVPSGSTASIKGAAAPPPKAKAAKTRKNAFALLAELAKGCPDNQAKLTAMLLPNHTVSHSGGRYPAEWAFESKTEEKSDTGYVGLKNLGCICYMNALIQQLFMLPDLRANLLSVELDEKKDPDPKESVLYQLQCILANLQESEKQYYNPEGFCYAFKDFDGKPTNVSIQEDAAGFYTRLIDKINEMVKGTPYADCIKDVLGGTFAHEFIGKGCPHYREREEEFYTVQLQVQNKKTMEEALQSFVQGEMLEGDNAYKCGVCNKKVDTLKRTCLKTLPPTVAFVLKRFELDYNTLQTTKLNNRLEFPMEIDLKPYCKESLAHPFPQQQAAAAAEAAAAAAADGKAAEGDGKSADGKAGEGEKPEEPVVRPDDYYKYELRGVVVHTGSATHGHYYSFIRERTTDEDGQPAPGRWFEFNDTIVRPFDPKDIPGECFGGTETYGGRGRSQYAGMGSASNMVQGPAAGGYEKSRSGYVLFYDRVKTKDTVPAKPKETADKAPPKILQQIWQNNVIYWRDKAVFDPVYFDFLYDLLAGEQKEGESADDDAAAAAPAVAVSGPLRPAECPDNIKLATMFVLNTLARAFHKQSLRNWISLLHRLYARNPTAAAWLLDTFTKTKWTQEFLLGCTDPDVRTQIGAFLCYALSLVSPHEQDSYDLPLPPESKEGKVPTEDSRGVVVRFIDGVVRLLRFCPESWKNFDPYWRVLAHFASLGHKEALYLHQHNFVAKLIDFYLGDMSPMPEISDIPVDANGKRRPIGDAWTHPDTTNFVLLLRSLICAVALSEEQLAAGTPLALEGLPKGTPIKVLSSSAHSLVLSRNFLGRIIFEADTRKKGLAVVDILGHICWENEKLSQNIIGMVVMAVESTAYDYLRPLMRCLMGLVQLPDSIQATRVDMVLNSLLAVMKAQARFWKPTDFCTEHLIRFAKKSDAVYKWLYEHQSSFDWLLGWIKANPKPPSAYDNTAQTILHKPGKGPIDRSYGGQYSSAALYPTHEGLSPRHKLIALQLIKDGTALGTEDASDSDVDLNDREFEVGQWVDVLDTANKWLCAQIVEVRKDGTVRVHYDGWPDKWNQNIDKASPRIQPLGKHTTKADWKLRGKPHPKEA